MKFTYQNPEESLDSRLEDLLSRMTLEEKIMQTDQYYVYDFTDVEPGNEIKELDFEKVEKLTKGMSAGCVQLRGCDSRTANQLQRYAVEKTRLGIPFLFCEEALHGFFRNEATCFPQQIGFAGTFEPELGRKMGECIAAEARAYGVHETFSPVMDLIRDPRYGRCEESYGEDTFLCGEFGRETVLGLQGEGIDTDHTVAAEPKHYVGYGAPVGGLNCAPCAMGRRDMFASCLPVFEEAYVNGKAMNAMCSYNSVDGQPVASDRELLTDILRGEFGMQGFVRTDLTAVSRLYGTHMTAETKEEAIRQGLEAGVDLQLYDFTHQEWQEGIKMLIESGQMKEEVLNQACARVLRMKFMLGLFEHPYTDERLISERVHCQKHQDTALEIARKGICLLKNENKLLPLSRNLKKIAVLGPGADEAALGDYCVDFNPEHMVTVLDGIREMAGRDTEVVYEKGCSYLGETLMAFRSNWVLDEDGNPGLTGRYYNGGTPEGTPVFTRTDQMISFNWIYVKPHPELESGRFSVCWTGKIKAPETIDAEIGFGGQDSVRVCIDKETVIDAWGDEGREKRKAAFFFEEGKEYELKIEFTNSNRAATVLFGYSYGKEREDAAVSLAREADAAVVCLGGNTETSGENFDRTDLNLPGGQLDFLKKIYATGTPVVLVLQNGRPLSITWEQEHIPAILEAWYPGEKGGRAVAEILFGETAPSGRLPISFPKSVGQVPCHYSRYPGGGVRYVEMDWNPLYPFGYGLTYTNFEYSGLTLSAEEIGTEDEITVSFRVKNVGDVFGEETAQVYLTDKFASMVKPIKELAGFQKVALLPGEEKEVSVTIGKRQMRTLGRDFVWRVEPGEFEVAVGDNAANVLLRERFAVREQKKLSK